MKWQGRRASPAGGMTGDRNRHGLCGFGQDKL